MKDLNVLEKDLQHHEENVIRLEKYFKYLRDDIHYLESRILSEKDTLTETDLKFLQEFVLKKRKIELLDLKFEIELERTFANHCKRKLFLEKEFNAIDK